MGKKKIEVSWYNIEKAKAQRQKKSTAQLVHFSCSIARHRGPLHAIALNERRQPDRGETIPAEVPSQNGTSLRRTRNRDSKRLKADGRLRCPLRPSREKRN
jgi:hypothetical protein